MKMWLRKWLPHESITLTLEGWCVEGHDVAFDKGNVMPRKMHYESGTCVWVLPPSETDIALEHLRFAKSKRVMSTHTFIVPRLFHALFRRQLHKEADMILLDPANVFLARCNV